MAQRGGRHPAKYRQIAADLRARIERGEWPADEKMPTQSELAEEYGGVAIGTVDKALGVLRELGIAETIHGMGTFVRAPLAPRPDLAAQVARLAERLGRLEGRVSELESGRQDG